MSKTQDEVDISVAIAEEIIANATADAAAKKEPERPKKRRARTAFWVILVVTVLCIAIAVTITAPTGHGALPSSATTSSGLIVTNGVAALHMNTDGFLQSSVTLREGEKLLLVSVSTEKHELYNGVWRNGLPEIQQERGAPLVNDVILRGDSITIGPFTTAGTYHIFDVLHRGMELAIIVR